MSSGPVMLILLTRPNMASEITEVEGGLQPERLLEEWQRGRWPKRFWEKKRLRLLLIHWSSEEFERKRSMMKKSKEMFCVVRIGKPQRRWKRRSRRRKHEGIH